jgi:aminopeptidase N
MYGGTGFFSGQFRDSIAYGTQMEPVYARKIFPCFDEPRFKATFELGVTVDDPSGTYSVVSNMNPSSTDVDGHVKTYKFDKTPLMSCYLLHWSIIPYPYIEKKTTSGIPVRIYQHPELIGRS